MWIWMKGRWTRLWTRWGPVRRRRPPPSAAVVAAAATALPAAGSAATGSAAAPAAADRCSRCLPSSPPPLLPLLILPRPVAAGDAGDDAAAMHNNLILPPCPAPLASQTFTEMDLTKDGVINPEEWLTLCQRNPGAAVGGSARPGTCVPAAATAAAVGTAAAAAAWRRRPPALPPTPPTPCRHHIFHDAAGADRGAPAAPQPFMKHTSSLLASREPACRPAGVCLPRCLACCAACQGAYTALQRPPTGPRCSAGVPAVPHATQICPRAAAAAAITSAAVPPLDPASSPALD